MMRVGGDDGGGGACSGDGGGDGVGGVVVGRVVEAGGIGGGGGGGGPHRRCWATCAFPGGGGGSPRGTRAMQGDGRAPGVPWRLGEPGRRGSGWWRRRWCTRLLQVVRLETRTADGETGAAGEDTHEG